MISGTPAPARSSERAYTPKSLIGSVGRATVQRGVQGGLGEGISWYTPGVLGSRINDLETRT